MPKIVIKIKKGGEATVESKGIAGPACKVATKAIEEALGKTVKDTPTSDMTKTSVSQTNTQTTGN